MATDTHDIREWARGKNLDIGDKGPIPAGVREAYQAREEGDTEAFPDDSPPAPDTQNTEVAPKQPTISSRVQAKIDTAKTRTRRTKAKTTGKRKADTGPRASIEAILTGVYGAFAGGVSKVDPSVGYIMSVQAPVAGMLLEDSLKGSAVDRILQPFAKNADRVRVGRALFGPPILVAFMQRNPDKAPFLMPMLRKMLADYIDLAGPKITEIQERERKFEEKYGQEVDQILEGLVQVIDMQNAPTNPVGSEA